MKCRLHIHKVRNNTIKRSQNGAILIVCLIFLVVLTAMAVGGMETTILEERMAGNMQDQNRAFQAAEASIEGAESWLRAQTTLPAISDKDDGGITDVWVSDSAAEALDTDPWWLERDRQWWADEADSVAGLYEVNTQPQYIIEEYHSGFRGNDMSIGGGGNVSTERTTHRVTARGTGANDNTQVLLQITYIRPYD